MNLQAYDKGFAEPNWRRSATIAASIANKFATLTTSASIGKILGKEAAR